MSVNFRACALFSVHSCSLRSAVSYSDVNDVTMLRSFCLSFTLCVSEEVTVKVASFKEIPDYSNVGIHYCCIILNM